MSHKNFPGNGMEMAQKMWKKYLKSFLEKVPWKRKFVLSGLCSVFNVFWGKRVNQSLRWYNTKLVDPFCEPFFQSRNRIVLVCSLFLWNVILYDSKLKRGTSSCEVDMDLAKSSCKFRHEREWLFRVWEWEWKICSTFYQFSFHPIC